MLYTLLSVVCLFVSLVLLLKTIGSQGNKIVLAEAPLTDQRIEFGILHTGHYTIWRKRKSTFQLRSRRFDPHLYQLFDHMSQQLIPLIHANPRTVPQPSSNRRESQWTPLYHFQATAGSYTLVTRLVNIERIPPLQLFKKLGFFNPFKEIRPEDYSIVITSYESFSTQLKDRVTLSIYCISTAGSLIWVLQRLSTYFHY